MPANTRSACTGTRTRVAVGYQSSGRRITKRSSTSNRPRLPSAGPQVVVVAGKRGQRPKSVWSSMQHLLHRSPQGGSGGEVVLGPVGTAGCIARPVATPRAAKSSHPNAPPGPRVWGGCGEERRCHNRSVPPRPDPECVSSGGLAANQGPARPRL